MYCDLMGKIWSVLVVSSPVWHPESQTVWRQGLT